MSQIRILPAHVADAIAAGEVVERPASVVKELVENSLDAGARRITIELRGAGRTLIRVADDGPGILNSELRLAFRRHATSKVASLDDLASISTLGFRGEALASIAAAADLECRSGPARIRLRGGRVIEEGAAIPAPGTVMEVRDLFGATPARLKFLRSEATETAACIKTAQAHAMLYPEVRFDLIVDGRTVLRTPGEGGPRAAVAGVLGAAVAAEMLEVDAEMVRGLVSQPRLSRGNREAILLAVNRRPVTSRALAYAVEECYLGALERGRYPVTVLEVELDPAEFDVNVHPAKREVRFRSERAVFAMLQRAVRAALGGSSPYRLVAAAPAHDLAVSAGARRTMTLHQAPARFEPLPDEPAALQQATPRPVGQVLDGYLVAEGPEGLVLVDQHAAHERVLYNRLLVRLSEGAAASQPLLIGEIVEVGAELAAVAGDNVSRLRSLGFDVEPFGPGAVRVGAAPAELPPSRVVAALEELLEVLARSQAAGLLEAAAASIACHSAVRFGDPLDLSEQRRLLQELEAAELAVTCPHGRPTRLVLAWEDLKRHFRRNY